MISGIDGFSLGGIDESNFNITSHEQVIIYIWYGGEMKNGMLSMMNYFLPLKGMASMHCSANTDKAVSYTHLDVYKRQSSLSNPVWISVWSACTPNSARPRR